jgi:hypothetical protein
VKKRTEITARWLTGVNRQLQYDEQKERLWTAMDGNGY